MTRLSLLHDSLTKRVIGAFYDVYHELRGGFVEGVYQNALSIRLRELAIAAEAEVALEVTFHGERVGWFRADLIVDKVVLVELKALPTLTNEHERQIINYLMASRLEVGLLLNFGPTPQVRRFVSETTKNRNLN